MQAAIGGGQDVFVTKVNAAGSALLYSTYLGGTSDDWGYAIAVDIAGHAFVTGQTSSTNFPTQSPLQPAFGGGNYDGFVAKLNPTGTALLFSTYPGGGSDDVCRGIALEANGDAYVTGGTTSRNFPTAVGFQAHSAGSYDAFVSKVNAAGTALLYSTYR